MYLYVEYCMHIEAGGVLDIAKDKSNNSNNIAMKKALTVTKHFSSFDVTDQKANVLILTIHQATNLASCDAFEGVTLRGLSDPIVYMCVDNPVVQNVAGEQEQRTSLVLTTLNPVWTPPEVFQFLLADPTEEKISITVMSQCGLDKTTLGLCELNVGAFTLGEERCENLLLLGIDLEPAGEVMVTVARMTIEEARVRSCFECL